MVGTVLAAIFASPVLVAWIQKRPDLQITNAKSTPNQSPPATKEQTHNVPSSSTDVTNAPVPTFVNVACITLLDSTQAPVEVDADSLRFSGGSSLPLANGQRIPFNEMKGFEVIDVTKSPPPVIRTTHIKIAITFLDGSIVSNVLDRMTGILHGATKVGKFVKDLNEVKKVEFKEQSSC